MTGKTTAERQRLYRERKAQAGETEVRGIYLPPELHKSLKALARDLKKSHKH